MLTKRADSPPSERCAQGNDFYNTSINGNGGFGVSAPDAECRVWRDPQNQAAGEVEANYNRGFGTCYRTNLGGQVYQGNGFLDFQVICGQ